MRSDVRGRELSSSASARTTEAVSRQITAMGSETFEIGVFKPETAEEEAIMLPRVWDGEALLRSVPWLCHQNRSGWNIYIRPKGEHNLSLVDDLSRDSVMAMKQAGFTPAAVLETSPGNFQVWLKHPEVLSREMGTAAARKLAERFGGDSGAADWRHFGRLAGFTNRKEKYCHPETGLHPFVKLMEASGVGYREGNRFLAEVRSVCEEERKKRVQREMAYQVPRCTAEVKSIESFRADPKYGGDGTRIDLAYAIYAASHGLAEGEIEAAIRSRDLSHKGGERRQADYIQRTVRKAFETALAQARGR